MFWDYRAFFYTFIIVTVSCVFPSIKVCSQNLTQKQDTITIYHRCYITTFSMSKHYPVVVKYWLTKAMVDCEHRFKRTNKFRPDPSIPEFTNLDKEYKKSGYDRGHQMDAYDCGCDSIAMAESFYYSNVAPQLPSLNRGSWKRLEEYIRKLARTYDSVLVWCGSVTLENRYIGRVAVPDYCWKIIYIRKFGIVKAYSFRNDIVTIEKIHSFEVSMDSIRNLSGFLFSAPLFKVQKYRTNATTKNH